MTGDPRISVDDAEQTDARGTSNSKLQALADKLPTIKTAGIRADHAQAAKDLVKKAKIALEAAARTNAETAGAAVKQVATDTPIARDMSNVPVPPTEV